MSRVVNVSRQQQQTQGSDQGKPGVLSMAYVAGIASGKTPRGLCTQPAAVLWSV